MDSKSYVVRQLLKQLIYSHFGDNNLVPFHFWPAEIMLKCEKVYKYFFPCRPRYICLFLIKSCLASPRVSAKKTKSAAFSSSIFIWSSCSFADHGPTVVWLWQATSKLRREISEVMAREMELTLLISFWVSLSFFPPMNFLPHFLG